MSNIEDFIAKVFCDVCELEEGSFSINEPLSSCGEWDSLNLLSLLTEIDDKYGVTIPSEIVDDFKTLKDFCEYIEKAI